MVHIVGKPYDIDAQWVETVSNRRIQFGDKTLFPMSSGKSEFASEPTNERSGANEWVSDASERANGGANGPVLYASVSQAFDLLRAGGDG